MDYNQIPAYPDGGKPTKFKDWITKIVEEIQSIKGTTNHYDAVPISLYQLSTQGNTVREFLVTSDLFEEDSETGLYKHTLNHGLKSFDYSLDIINDMNEDITYTVNRTSENEIDIYTIENVNCKILITLLTKAN